MRFALLLVPQATPLAAPDLTRYLLVCGSAIAVLIGALWVFRRFVAERIRARAAKRSLQVVDVLPLSSKHKLVVVRCYDRTFLLGLGEKEVRSIAELEPAEARAPQPAAAPGSAAAGPTFERTLEGELVVQPALPRGASRTGLEKGVLA
jgi:flagellar biogenesis protein FliO